MSIGPNGGKPICHGWEQTPQKFQPAFGNTFNKFFQAFQFIESGLGLQNVSLFGSQAFKPPSMISADKKIPGLGFSSGKGRG